MEKHIVKILATEWVTHNVRRFTLEKPEGFNYTPGQATEISINTPELREEKRPFTFTSLNEKTYLEFTIKIYTDHDGITNKLGKIMPGEELIIRDVWGTISYRGPGTFIAGGAGVTPFIAIFRQLYSDNQIKGNRLIFSNRTSKDIILHDEFNKMLGNNFINTLTEENNTNFDIRRIDDAFLKEKINDFNQPFYVCGPKQFMKDILKALKDLGANPDVLVFEK
jgi:ferredoxin-NADP reductase